MRFVDVLGRWNPKHWFWRAVTRAMTALYASVLERLERRTARRVPPVLENRFEILLTGTFHSLNWQVAHLLPLADCARVARLIIVSTSPPPPHPKIEWVAPPRWLVRLIGAVPARLVCFWRTGLRRRPHWVGGFHLLFNGMVALVLARLVKARAMYFCVGGEAEVRDGGLLSENRLFTRQSHPDPLVEQRLVEVVRRFDLTLTMGSRAREWFRARGRALPTEIAAGGLDAVRFAPDLAVRKDFDLIYVGRLVPIKRLESLLETVALLKGPFPAIRTLIVGEGPERRALEALSARLGLAEAVCFAGAQSAIETWLRRARIFVLTSRSEGLSLALIEAMLCGLPAVVPDVGDLPDLVTDGVNGFLVTGQSPRAYAEALSQLLVEPERYRRFAQAARAAALRYERRAATRRWEEFLSGSLHGVSRCENTSMIGAVGDAPLAAARATDVSTAGRHQTLGG